jgi:hypothetical protein
MKCCFCNQDFEGLGNSTWPIYPDAIHCEKDMPNGAQMRCCDNCNQKYVITARVDPMVIMHIRNLFGINCANM